MKIFFQTLLFFLFITQINFAQGFWTKVGDLPEKRYGHTVDEINGKVYVIGGVIDEGSAYPTHSLVYDRSTGEWSQMNLYNNSLRGVHNSCVVDGKLYIVGGNDGVRTIATMEMFDPSTDKWTSKTPMPTDRGLAACAVIDDKIYVIGGIRGALVSPDWEGLNKVEVYDTKNDNWTQLADMPTKRWGHSAVAFNGKIYVFGGRSTGIPYNSIHVYDPQTDTWVTESSKMPTPRYCITTCVFNDRVFIIGGWWHSSEGPLYDKVEVYNPISDKWETGTPLPAKLAVLACTVIDSKIYVYGGARTTHPNMGTSGIYEFSYHDIYTVQPNINKTYAKGNVDSILFTTKISNIYNHPFSIYLSFANSSGTMTDSVRLFDDGLHGDSLFKDGVYGGFIPPQSEGDFYSLGVSILDSLTSNYSCRSNILRFTTAGPVTVDSVLFLKGRSWYSIRPFVRNRGDNVVIKNVSIRPICTDPWVTSFIPATVPVPNLFPDSLIGASEWWNVGYIDTLCPGYFDLKFEIISNGSTFWTDSLKATITGIKDKSLNSLTFKLEQNYPNPFNPSTKINYSIPAVEKRHASSVQLKIFNVLGQEIATLVNEEKPAGTYEVTWNATNLPSGVYFYQLRAGSYTVTKKLMLLK